VDGDVDEPDRNRGPTRSSVRGTRRFAQVSRSLASDVSVACARAASTSDCWAIIIVPSPVVGVLRPLETAAMSVAALRKKSTPSKTCWLCAFAVSRERRSSKDAIIASGSTTRKDPSQVSLARVGHVM
jgi:hypothetical protein